MTALVAAEIQSDGAALYHRVGYIINIGDVLLDHKLKSTDTQAYIDTAHLT